MKIRVIERLSIPAGTPLALTDDQFNRRQQMLTMRNGQIMGVVSIEFKAGEVLEVVGDMPKAVPESAYQLIEDADEDSDAGKQLTGKADGKKPKNSKAEALASGKSADEAGDNQG